jgi:hypothetical protein
MDMVGRLNDSSKAITGVRYLPAWNGNNIWENSPLKIKIDSWQRGLSDHTSFYRK